MSIYSFLLRLPLRTPRWSQLWRHAVAQTFAMAAAGNESFGKARREGIITSLPHADPKVRAEGAIGAKGMALPHGYATSLRERTLETPLETPSEIPMERHPIRKRAALPPAGRLLGALPRKEGVRVLRSGVNTFILLWLVPLLPLHGSWFRFLQVIPDCQRVDF